VMPGYGPSE